MATKCGRLFKTTSSISTIKSFISKPKPSPLSKPATSSFTRSTLPELNPPRRFSISRSPVELASMLPLHSAVATARMTSCLSASIGSCRALSQGTLCCTSPDLYLYASNSTKRRISQNFKRNY